MPNELISHGQIHPTLLSEAGRLRQRGHTIEAIETLLLSWSHEHCAPPIDEKKVIQIARSMANYPAGKPFTTLIGGKPCVR